MVTWLVLGLVLDAGTLIWRLKVAGYLRRAQPFHSTVAVLLVPSSVVETIVSCGVVEASR